MRPSASRKGVAACCMFFVIHWPGTPPPADLSLKKGKGAKRNLQRLELSEAVLGGASRSLECALVAKRAVLGADSVARGKRAGAALFRVSSLLYFYSRDFLSVWFFGRTFYVSVSRNCDCIAVTAMSAVCVCARRMSWSWLRGDERRRDLGSRAAITGRKSEGRLYRDNWEIAGATRCVGARGNKRFSWRSPRPRGSRATSPCMRCRAHCASFQLSFFVLKCVAAGVVTKETFTTPRKWCKTGVYSIHKLFCEVRNSLVEKKTVRAAAVAFASFVFGEVFSLAKSR